MLTEASYRGNIGVMEMFKFYNVATDEQKAKMKQLIADKNNDEAWALLQKVLKVKLHSL